jgi:SnoaL-like domain
VSPPARHGEGPATGPGPHEELRALLQRYGRAADERDIDTLSSLFHPESEIVGAHGVQTREEWLDTMRAPRSFPASMHMISDPLIEIADTVEEASVDTYAVVYQLGDPSDGSGDLTLGIRYRDHCVVHGGRWVIARRLSTTLWMR